MTLQTTLDLTATPWSDLAGDAETLYPSFVLERIGLLHHGIAPGRDSVQMIARGPDGKPILVEADWDQLRPAIRALYRGVL